MPVLDRSSGVIAPVTAPPEAYEFHHHHGPEYITDSFNNRLYPSGAFCGPDLMRRYEPPTDRRELLANKKRYNETKLQQAEDAFFALKSAALDRRGSFSWDMLPLGWPKEPPTMDEEELIRFFRDKVRQYRAALAEIEQEVFNSPEAIAARAHAERMKKLNEEMRQRAEEKRNRIDAIEI